jgi:DNA-binding transcriptional MerR regulator
VPVATELTIDELAQQAGTKTSTVRMYQSRGLLDPPQVHGRVGYYSAAHLERLRAIGQLQQRGYSLAAIKELFDGHRRGARLDDLLGIARGREPAELSPEDFLALFPSGEIDPAVLARAIDLGLVELIPDGSGMRAPSPTFVEVGRALAEYGVPPEAALDEYEALTADARRIADRYVALFERHVAGTDPGRLTPERLTELAAAIDRFRALAADAVHEALERALDQAATEAATRHTY